MNKKDKLRVIEEANKKLLKEDTNPQHQPVDAVTKAVIMYIKELNHTGEEFIPRMDVMRKLVGIIKP